MKNLQKAVLILLLFFLVFGGAYFGRNFLIPIALSGVFALMVMPISRFLERKNFPHWLATLLPVLLLFCFLTGLILIVIFQVRSMRGNFDEMHDRFLDIFKHIQSWLSDTLGLGEKRQEEIISKQSNKAGQLATSFVAGLSGLLMGTVIVTVYTFLLLYMRNHFKRFLLKLIPDQQREQGRDIIRKTASVVPSYIGGMILMIMCLWVLYGIGFSIVGVKGAIVFAILCGVLELIPFVGNIVGTSLTGLMVLAQGGDTKMLLGVGIVYLFVQVFQGNVLQPLIVGDKVNINPFFTIASLFLGEMVWGVAGMLLALPLMGMLKIIFDHIPKLEPYGYLIGSERQDNRENRLRQFLERIFPFLKRKKNAHADS